MRIHEITHGKAIKAYVPGTKSTGSISDPSVSAWSWPSVEISAPSAVLQTLCSLQHENTFSKWLWNLWSSATWSFCTLTLNRLGHLKSFDYWQDQNGTKWKNCGLQTTELISGDHVASFRRSNVAFCHQFCIWFKPGHCSPVPTHQKYTSTFPQLSTRRGVVQVLTIN